MCGIGMWCDDLLTGAVVCGDCDDGTDHDDLQNVGCFFAAGEAACVVI